MSFITRFAPVLPEFLGIGEPHQTVGCTLKTGGPGGWQDGAAKQQDRRLLILYPRGYLGGRFARSQSAPVVIKSRSKL